MNSAFVNISTKPESKPVTLGGSATTTPQKAINVMQYLQVGLLLAILIILIAKK